MPPVNPSTIFLPARSIEDSWKMSRASVTVQLHCPPFPLFADAPQLVVDEQDRADADRAVGDVEGRPVPAAQMEVEKIDDVAVDQAVDDVADCTAENQRQRPAEQPLTGMPVQQPDDEQRCGNPHHREEVTLPAAA